MLWCRRRGRCICARDSQKLTSDTLQDSITLEDEKPKRPSGDENRRMNNQAGAPRRNEPAGPSHRPTASQEDSMRAKRMQGGGSRRPDGPSQSPHRRTERRRPRRNSDSSLLIDIEKPLTEEEKKARDARRRERERRHRPSRPNRKVDLIDQLDMTGVYGIGGKFPARHLPTLGLSSPPQTSATTPMSPFRPEDPTNIAMQPSTMTDPSTHATPTETARAAVVLR